VLARLIFATLVALSAFFAATAASAASSYRDVVVGAEYPPITSRLGTFIGVATGQLPGDWRAQIIHQPLSRRASVPITGGSFTMHAITGNDLHAPITGGSVSVINNGGSGCANQSYAVTARFQGGSFSGMLTHHRHTILGRCLIYSATITGQATLPSARVSTP
jgi:hypothetical protein